MTLSLAQRAKLILVRFGLYLLLLIESFGTIPEKVTSAVLRVSMYLFIVTTVLLSVSLDGDSSSNYGFSYLVEGQRTVSSNILGISKSSTTPYVSKFVPFPEISAASVYAIHPETGTLFYSKDAEKQFPPASTTKLMTALVSRDLYSLDDELVVPTFCTAVEGQKIGFLAGEKVKVRDLLYALLIPSAGDAACTLASNSGIDFVDAMNKKSASLGITNTRFSNSIGLDDIADGQLTTAHDLYEISRIAIGDDLIKEIVKTTDFTFNTNINTITVYNTNALLWGIPGSVGIKTGKTDGAGEVLIYEYDNNDVNVAIVVMSSNDRFGDTRKLLEWIQESYVFNSQ